MQTFSKQKSFFAICIEMICNYLFEVGLHIILKENHICAKKQTYTQKYIKRLDPKPLDIGYFSEHIRDPLLHYSEKSIKCFTTQATWTYDPLYSDRRIG